MRGFHAWKRNKNTAPSGISLFVNHLKKCIVHAIYGARIMAKSVREKIRMNSTAGTGHFYTTTKNKRNMTGKLEMKKYDPVVREHVLYKEGKIK